MTEERKAPPRQRMTDDIGIRALGRKTRSTEIRNVEHFATFVGRSPDTATPQELRQYRKKMSEIGTSASTFNVRIISLRFVFGITCGREDMKGHMRFHRKPCETPIVLSVGEVA
ncbi:MAG: phage integrase N-terminal SAM-like domain-containing protein [Pseudomonadota bacterium]